MATKKLKSKSIQLVADLYDKLKEEERIEDRAKALNIEINELKSMLYSEMENDNLDRLTYKELNFVKADKVQFSLADNLKGKKWDEVDEFFKWLKETNNADLINSSVNPQTRNATLRRIYEEDPAKIPGFIKVSFFNTVDTRKA